jgi:hypothetical protein
MLRLALAVAAAPTLACLTPPDDDVVQWYDDFEGCEDLCGWSTTGAVTRTTTYHPGEHGLALAPGASARHPLSIARQAPNQDWQEDFSDGNWVELTTDCAGPGALDLRLVGDDLYAIELTLDQRGLERFSPHRLTFPPLPPDRPASFESIEVTAGALPCRIDNLQVRLSKGRLVY